MSKSWRKMTGFLLAWVSARLTAEASGGFSRNLRGGVIEAARAMAEAAGSLSVLALWRMYGMLARVAVLHWITAGFGAEST